jgi:hypothetical protein
MSTIANAQTMSSGMKSRRRKNVSQNVVATMPYLLGVEE